MEPKKVTGNKKKAAAAPKDPNAPKQTRTVSPAVKAMREHVHAVSALSELKTRRTGVAGRLAEIDAAIAAAEEKVSPELRSFAAKFS